MKPCYKLSRPKTVVLSFAFLAVLLDLLVYTLIESTGIAQAPLAHYSADILKSKIHAFDSHIKKQRVLYLGDSVILGKTLKKFEEGDWRLHTLPRQLEPKIKRTRNSEVYTMNAGLNGCVPKDMFRLAKLFSVSSKDIVILNVSLRSLSKDFWSSDQLFSRSWLQTLNRSSTGHILRDINGLGRSKAIETTFSDFAAQLWYFYGHKDLLRSFYMGPPLRHVVKQNLENINAALQNTSEPDDLMVLLLKGKKRYSRVELSDKNPQLSALVRLLSYIKEKGATALIFYSPENPDLLDEIIEPGLYRDLREKLDNTILGITDQSRKMHYIKSFENLSADLYIDHVHVKRKGYRKMAVQLARHLSESP